MGFAYKDYCYPTQAEAAARVCANSYPVEYNNGATLYVASCTGVNGSNALTITRTANGASPTALTIPTAFSTCTWSDYPSSPAHLSPTDGALVAAAIASVWASAWAWKALASVVRGNENDPE